MGAAANRGGKSGARERMVHPNKVFESGVKVKM